MAAEVMDRATIRRAYRLIFGGTPGPDSFAPGRLDLRGLKRAFRKRVLETHPDRAVASGGDQAIMMRQLMEVKSAFETLQTFLYNGAQTARPVAPSGNGRRRSSPPNDRFYRGTIPQRELRLGEFMYFSGRISWNVLIEAITWQRRRRQRFGQIALGWRILTTDEVATILRTKTFGELFGEFALRNGYISPFERMAVVGKQRHDQPPLGHRFVTTGRFSDREIEEIVRSLDVHNQKIRRLRAGMSPVYRV